MKTCRFQSGTAPYDYVYQFHDDGFRLQQELAAMEKIAANETGDAAALTPNYLRQAQAERTRQHDKDFYLKK